MDKQMNRSRRSLLKGAALAAGTTLAATLIPIREAQAKTPKDAVAYQEKPNNGQKCSECNFFQPPKTCSVVDGDISPDGWCKLFTKKP